MIGEMISVNLGLLLLAQGTLCLAAGLVTSYVLRRRAAGILAPHTASLRIVIRWKSWMHWLYG